MASDNGRREQVARPPRRTLRLTFQVAGEDVRLLSYERVDMLCPPSIGEQPQAGKHGGFWIELRTTRGRVLFHRVLPSPLADSVEVHSPDGKIERIFGPSTQSVFEVLLPDDPDAKSIALVGEPLGRARRSTARQAGAAELARFDVPEGDRGGEVPRRGGRR